MTMPNAPDVSVIMTVRNGAAFIGDALDSVYAQTARPREIVVVDDGSTDETPAILSRYAQHPPAGGTDPLAVVRVPAPRLRVLRAGNVGRAAALNLAWRSAGGKFIANLDADDVFAPRKLELQIEALYASPELELLATASYYFAANGSQGEGCGPDAYSRDATGSAAPLRNLAPLLCRYNPVNHSSVVMRRSLLERLGGYASHRTRQLDYELWIRAAIDGASVAMLDAPLTGKRIHAGQTFEARDHLRYVLSSFSLQLRAIYALQPGAGLRAAAARTRLYLLAALRVAYRMLPLRLRRRLASAKESTLRR